MKPVLIYCYDAYCGWCYGFSPVIKEVNSAYRHLLDVEVLSGGMILPENPIHISATASYIQQAYMQVEKRTGIKFGEDYLWHINNPQESDWHPNSEKPAIAMCVFKDYFPELQVHFATDLQYALHGEGRDLNDDEAYRYILFQYNIPAKDFYDKLHSPDYKEKAYYEFALIKQLQVTGFPCVFIQASDLKFYLVARGYTSFSDINQRIENVLEELALSKS